MKEVTKSAKTVEEAVEAAARELNTTKDSVKFRVVEEPKKGFLGLGSKLAVVQVTENIDPIEAARTFLQTVTEKMGVPVRVEMKQEGRRVVLQLSAEKAAILIGKHGNTLNALQYLTNLAANRQSDGNVHVILDVENYRAKREEALKQLAKRLSEKSVRTGREVKLEPMPSMERRVIHMTLKNWKGITTYSDGVDPHRKVIIAPAKK